MLRFLFLLTASLALLLLLPACNPLQPLDGGDRINVTIELDPATQFIMKGAGEGDFVVRYQNVGETPVDVDALRDDAPRLNVDTIQPDGILRMRFTSGTTALVINRSRSTASVRAEVIGDTRIAMRYAPVGDEQPGD